MTSTHGAIYRRVSTVQQIGGFSLDEQLDTLTTLAESNGWTYVDFVDAGRSGEALDNRPALTDLLSRLNEFDAVLVIDDSRLARDEYVSAFIRQELRESDTKLITPSGTVDLNDPQSQFMSGVISLAHQLEQRLRTKKMIAGHRRTALAGFSTGGPPPFGYRYIPDPKGSTHKVLEVSEDEAEVLRKAVRLVLDDGLSVYKAAQHLNSLSLLTRSGTPWEHRNLAGQLKKELITGVRTYEATAEPISYSIPSIIERGEWDLLQAAIRGKRTGKPRKNNIYPLTGHLDCPCGGHRSGFPRPNGRSYKCSRNKAEWGDRRCDQYPRFLDADQLEGTVWTEVKKVLTDPEYLRQLLETHLATHSPSTRLGTDQRQSLKGRIRKRRQEQVRITRDYASAGIDAQVLKTAISEISAEIKALEEQLLRAGHWEEVRKAKTEALEALKALAERAREKLAYPTLDLMEQVFDLLALRVLVTDHGLELKGTTPIDAWVESGTIQSELRAEAPLVHEPRQPRSGPAVA